VRAELFRADGKTGITKLIVAFRDFAKVPKTHLMGSNNSLTLFPTQHFGSAAASSGSLNLHKFLCENNEVLINYRRNDYL
jgi:hypothetical protein